MSDDERRDFAEHYDLDPDSLPPRLADARVVGTCRICELPEERDGLCPGHREEWILWAANHPWAQNEDRFDWWVDSRRMQVTGITIEPARLEFDARELAILNALVTYAMENVPGGWPSDSDERAIARKVGALALGKR